MLLVRALEYGLFDLIRIPMVVYAVHSFLGKLSKTCLLDLVFPKQSGLLLRGTM